VDALIVDDHPLMHELLAEAVRKAFGKIDCHHANTLESALDRAANCGDLGLVMLDLGLPGCTGLDALHSFRTRFPDPKVVVCSAVDGAPAIRGAFRLGATGFIPKTSPPAVLLAALRLVASGGRYVPPEVLAEEDATKLDLTPRQQEVLTLMVQGLSNRAIAAALKISEVTVKQHATDIYHSLRVPGREQAIAVAKRMGDPQ
jgi:DNA-binding NarL/FixJ family response regulator